MTTYSLPIAGARIDTGSHLDVTDKYHGTPAYQVAMARQEDVEAAIAAARLAVHAPLPAHRRYEILTAAADRLAERRDEFVRTLITEGGKPRKASLREIERTVETLRWSAEEAKRIDGEAFRLDASRDGVGRWAMTLRSPVGVVCAITPSNSPVNLLAHKLGPALAAGNAVIVKPPRVTPVTTIMLTELLYEAGLPGGFLSVLVAQRWLGDALLEHEGIDFFTFTGSIGVGQHLRSKIGLRPSLLELGGNGPVIVHEDAVVREAAAACAAKGYASAGQACTAVQRIFVHAAVWDAFLEQYRNAVERLVVGDPHEPTTDVGPMIDEREAVRLETWIAEAVASGATPLLLGERNGPVLAPTVLLDVPRTCKVYCEEAFGPVTVVERYDALDDAIEAANGTAFGLHAAIFTESLEHAFTAIERLDAGGVLVNEATQWRTEFVPFGGVKQSGLGREGPRYAVDAMSRLKVAMIRPSFVR